MYILEILEFSRDSLVFQEYEKYILEEYENPLMFIYIFKDFREYKYRFTKQISHKQSAYRQHNLPHIA